MITKIKQLIRKLSQRIVETGSPIRDRSLYEYHEHNFHFSRCLWFIGENAIKGDIIEFGVSSGSTLVLIDRIAKNLLTQRQKMDYQIFGFDSFEGMPEPTGKDKYAHADDNEPGVKFTKGQFAASKEGVMQRLKDRGVNIDKVHLVEGWFDQVLTPNLRTELGLNQASLINIDCDFYESTVVALDWCEPLMQQGTIINFDDYYCYKGSPDHGEMLAFKEFLDKHTDITTTPYSQYSWHGQAFIINRHTDTDE